uniref:Uncharacterized protein n=1 Tax=Chromera velia CCMP2878 TaxID=1169474 RepID=A0A0G4I4N4_9ALVE|eukprot:Cvel_10949.t1-p1 / transcript=Cvel_10949.t1 / gene=Cvel_10949 / organism=Chromera_velia_CCMP2878 / gene_product=hypothetical protein / transcript_product=hypothetical protein / location=Cvel_scaffold673:38288-39553(-) / protein_length=422 / sequence_SO=supercontig / SO=protein_coding / is_pseudo=false
MAFRRSMGDQLEDGSGCVSASLEEWFQDVAVDAQSATSTETQQELNVAAEPVTLPSFLAPSEPADLPDLDSVSPGGLEEPDGQGCKSSDDSALWGWKVFSFAPSIPNCADSRSRRFRPLARPRPQTEDLLLGTLTEEDASDIEGGELVSRAVVETESTDRNVEGGTRKGDMSGPSPHSLEPPPHLISNSRQTSESGHLMDWREVRRRESLSSYEALIPRNLTPSLALDELRKKDVVIEALRRTLSVMECDFRREIAAWQKQLQTERERAEVAQKTIQMMSQQEAVLKAESAKMTEAHFRGVSASSERIRQAEADAKTACGWVESLAQVVRTARASEAKAVSSMGILQGDKLMAEGKLRQAEWKLGELREREMEFASLMEEKEQREKDLLKRLEEKEKEEMDLRNRLGEKDKRGGFAAASREL